MSRGRVLIVEDDLAIRRGLVDALRFAGFAPLEAGDGASGLRTALSAEIDLILLDVVLPEMSGFEVLTRVRSSRPGLPVIMLTAKGAEEDRIRGLESGADDYVVKPFSARELLARVEAVLRRSPHRSKEVGELALAGRRVDFDRRVVAFDDGATVELSQREAELLHYLASHAGRAVPRDELLSSVWGLDPRGVRTRTVDMHVARLRERLRDHADGDGAEIIRTIRSKGYMFVTPETGS